MSVFENVEGEEDAPKGFCDPDVRGPCMLMHTRESVALEEEKAMRIRTTEKNLIMDQVGGIEEALKGNLEKTEHHLNTHLTQLKAALESILQSSEEQIKYSIEQNGRVLDEMRMAAPPADYYGRIEETLESIKNRLEDVAGLVEKQPKGIIPRMSLFNDKHDKKKKHHKKQDDDDDEDDDDSPPRRGSIVDNMKKLMGGGKKKKKKGKDADKTVMRQTARQIQCQCGTFMPADAYTCAACGRPRPAGAHPAEKDDDMPKLDHDELDLEAEEMLNELHRDEERIRIDEFLLKWRLPHSWGRTDGACSGLVQSRCFKLGGVLLITFSTLFVGAETTHRLARAREGLPAESTYVYIDNTLSSLFALELIMKIIGERIAFFVSSDWYWNYMDMFFVLSDAFNFIISLAIDVQGVSSQDAMSSLRSSLRTIRLTRAVRALRAIRAFSFIKRVKFVLEAMGGSMMHSSFLMVLLALMFFFFSIVFMQATIESFNRDREQQDTELTEFFGSVWGSSVTLLKLVSGGISWDVVHDVLDNYSDFYGTILIFYVFFMRFTFLNAVSAMFVETAISLKQKREAQGHSSATRALTQCIYHADERGEGIISLKEWGSYISRPHVRDTLLACGLEKVDVITIFKMLSKSHHQKQVQLEELTHSCVRFTRPLRNADLAHLLLEQQKVSDHLSITFDTVNSGFRRLGVM
eukprot:TRINITY_DN21233_c0_g7_i1.p1 TRINITY_DN21233_c0_g7~~TRINITY_DN21233_c0_g7_i1.p1  ORF type:complete len:693 (+),score=158.39 TRINITY_DN21233_c0_g7_i1:294-2372(+)